MGGLCSGSQGFFFRRARPGRKHPGRCVLSLVADLGPRVMGLHSLPVGVQILDRHFKGQKIDGTWWQSQEKWPGMNAGGLTGRIPADGTKQEREAIAFSKGVPCFLKFLYLS